jgi:hypothetical protein
MDTEVKLEKSGIAWTSDKNRKYRNPGGSWSNVSAANNSLAKPMCKLPV